MCEKNDRISFQFKHISAESDNFIENKCKGAVTHTDNIFFAIWIIRRKQNERLKERKDEEEEEKTRRINKFSAFKFCGADIRIARMIKMISMNDDDDVILLFFSFLLVSVSFLLFVDYIEFFF